VRTEKIASENSSIEVEKQDLKQLNNFLIISHILLI